MQKVQVQTFRSDPICQEREEKIANLVACPRAKSSLEKVSTKEEIKNKTSDLNLIKQNTPE